MAQDSTETKKMMDNRCLYCLNGIKKVTFLNGVLDISLMTGGFLAFTFSGSNDALGMGILGIVSFLLTICLTIGVLKESRGYLVVWMFLKIMLLVVQYFLGVTTLVVGAVNIIRDDGIRSWNVQADVSHLSSNEKINLEETSVGVMNLLVNFAHQLENSTAKNDSLTFQAWNCTEDEVSNTTTQPEPAVSNQTVTTQTSTPSLSNSTEATTPSAINLDFSNEAEELSTTESPTELDSSTTLNDTSLPETTATYDNATTTTKSTAPSESIVSSEIKNELNLNSTTKGEPEYRDEENNVEPSANNGTRSERDVGNDPKCHTVENHRALLLNNFRNVTVPFSSEGSNEERELKFRKRLAYFVKFVHKADHTEAEAKTINAFCQLDKEVVVVNSGFVFANMTSLKEEQVKIMIGRAFYAACLDHEDVLWEMSIAVGSIMFFVAVLETFLWVLVKRFYATSGSYHPQVNNTKETEAVV